jgi:hypothetical protein
MPVADLPPLLATAPAEETTDVIEVIAGRTNTTLKIDRRTYEVRETPHSAQKDAFQLLRGLPAVTVTPDNRVLILGAGLTKIYVDGRPYLGDVGQYLRTLHGSDIERIEVITNPSAQFSSEGGGGVINLVLRTTRSKGLSGNASLEQSSYGNGLFDTTLNYRATDWSYELKGGGNIGAMARRKYYVRRSVEADGGIGPIVNLEKGRFNYEGTVGRLSGKATYQLDSRTSLSAQLGGGGGHDMVTDKVRYEAVTRDFVPFSERRRLDSFASYVTGAFNMDSTGKKEGETFNAGVQFYTNPAVHDVTDATLSKGSRYRIEGHTPATSIDTQADWKHPMQPGQLLSLGSSWHLDRTSQDYRFMSDDTASFGPDTSDAFTGRSSTFAAYASFQQTFGALMLAPGLRGEANRRVISGPGGDDVQIRRTDLFPSFHASYKVDKTLEFGASFSRRIDRAPLEYLRPYSVAEDVYTVFQGNPRLRDQSIDAYEVSMQFRPGKIEVGATAYLRETHGLWSKEYSVDNSSFSVYRYVNAGSSWNTGVQFDVSFPIISRVRGSASANLFDDRTPIDAPDGRTTQRNFRYSTNGTVEWNGKDRASIPGDVAQVQWSYNSPSRAYQVREAAWLDLSLAYTHSFDRTLSLSGTFRYAGRTSQRLVAPSIEEWSRRQKIPEIQLKLQKAL